MKNSFFLLLVLMLQFLNAQKKQVPQEILESIKHDVWIPFMEAYAQLDAKKLKSIHDSDIFRVTMDQNTVKTGQTYLDDFGGFLDKVNANGGGLGIAFAISTTAIDSSGNRAYQTGYYEFSSRNHDDPDLMVRGYGHFSVALRKTEGLWKLFLDADRRVDINLEEFESQAIVYRLDN
ncbi:MAG: nuclear transport factor 2 family protein [Bacteroidota bacterium]